MCAERPELCRQSPVLYRQSPLYCFGRVSVLYQQDLRFYMGVLLRPIRWVSCVESAFGISVKTSKGGTGLCLNRRSTTQKYAYTLENVRISCYYVLYTANGSQSASERWSRFGY
jgi:hypothetical protein